VRLVQDPPRGGLLASRAATHLLSSRMLHVMANQMARPLRSEPFSIHIDEAVLADLRDRVRKTRWPHQIPGIGGSRAPTLTIDSVHRGLAQLGFVDAVLWVHPPGVPPDPRTQESASPHTRRPPRRARRRHGRATREPALACSDTFTDTFAHDRQCASAAPRGRCLPTIRTQSAAPSRSRTPPVPACSSHRRRPAPGRRSSTLSSRRVSPSPKRSPLGVAGDLRTLTPRRFM
jgi:hypothetical protein